VIPPFTASGILPPGIHDADDWGEVAERFGGTPARETLLEKLRLGLENLRNAGCPWVLLDGSFVTSKPGPNDADGYWQDTSEMNLDLLDSCFLLRNRDDRAALQQRYGMDFFPASLIEAGSGLPFSAFFQRARDGTSKGIVRYELGQGPFIRDETAREQAYDPE
jgi:uncharacterized protein DUF6932